MMVISHLGRLKNRTMHSRPNDHVYYFYTKKTPLGWSWRLQTAVLWLGVLDLLYAGSQQLVLQQSRVRQAVGWGQGETERKSDQDVRVIKFENGLPSLIFSSCQRPDRICSTDFWGPYFPTKLNNSICPEQTVNWRWEIKRGRHFMKTHTHKKNICLGDWKTQENLFLPSWIY